MRVTASGDVGIGTSAPVGKLDIVTGTNRGYFDDAGTTLFRLNAVNAANSAYVPLSLNGSIQTFQIGAAEKMRIDASGNVGIGTSSPDAKLTAIGSATISSQVNVAARFGANTTSDLLLGSVTGNTPFIASQGAYPVTVYTNATERMRIDASGNVGIGTTSTTNKLQIDGGAVQNTGTGNIGQYELVSGSASTWYNSGWRNDGSSVYFLLSNVQTTQAAAKTASFNSLRPIVINLATGQVNIDATGAGGTTFGGAALAVGAGGIGYGTGSGGAVTQLTSRTTGVTLNKTNGAITMFSAAGTTSPQTFVVTNSTVAISDVVVVSVRSSTNVYSVSCTSTSAGAFAICFYSLSGTATDAPVINFAVIKASVS